MKTVSAYTQSGTAVRHLFDKNVASICPESKSLGQN